MTKLNKTNAIAKINDLVESNISFSVESHFKYWGRFGTDVRVSIIYLQDGSERRIDVDGRARASVQKFMCELLNEKYFCEQQNVTYSWESKQTEETQPVNVDQENKETKMSKSENEIITNLEMVSPDSLKFFGANAETLDHDEWLAIRTRGIGGSDVGSIMGVDGAFGSPLSVYYSKIGEPEPNEGSEPMRWGSILEETIRNEYKLRSGLQCLVVDATIYNPDHPHRLANTDGFVLENGEWGILEIKNVGFTSGDWSDGRVPQKYFAQVQWYMLVTGLKFAKVVALVNGQTLIERHIDFDLGFVSLMTDATDSFWNDVKNKVQPKSSGNPRCREVLAKLYPPTDDSVVEMDDNQTDLDLWLDYSKHEKEFKKLKDQTANRIIEKLGNSKKGSFQGKSVVSHSESERRSVDYKILENEHPDVYKQVVKKSSSSMYRITYKGAK